MPFLLYWKWILLALLLAAIGIQTARLGSCQRGAEEYKVKAEARELALKAQIRVQNDAVAALAAESKAKQQKASKALSEASRAAVGAIKEADRLRALSRSGSATTACPAGQAVEEIRRGLR